jgi:hypothetical protein
MANILILPFTAKNPELERIALRKEKEFYFVPMKKARPQLIELPTIHAG